MPEAAVQGRVDLRPDFPPLTNLERSREPQQYADGLFCKSSRRGCCCCAFRECARRLTGDPTNRCMLPEEPTATTMEACRLRKRQRCMKRRRAGWKQRLLRLRWRRRMQRMAIDRKCKESLMFSVLLQASSRAHAGKEAGGSRVSRMLV